MFQQSNRRDEGAGESAWQTRNGDVWVAWRKPQPDEALQPQAIRWMARLPADLRPLELGRRYARIANRMSALWVDYHASAAYLTDLLVDKRGGRQGFPMRVADELWRLRSYHQTMCENSESVWGAVHDRRSER